MSFVPVLLARPERFELPTNWFEANYSIQLSYGRVEGELYRLSGLAGTLMKRSYTPPNSNP